MRQATTGRALAALLAGSLFLGACGNGNVSTNTPTSTLGTDSAAAKVGGTVDSVGAANVGTSGNGAGTSGVGGATTGGAGAPATGGTGPSGTTNGTGAN